MKIAQPKFQNISYRKNVKNITELASNVDSMISNEIRVTKRQPTITLDCWTSQNGTAYLGSTCHFSRDFKLRNYVLFLKELPRVQQQDFDYFSRRISIETVEIGSTETMANGSSKIFEISDFAVMPVENRVAEFYGFSGSKD